MNLLHKIRYQKFRLNSNTKFDTNPTVDDQPQCLFTIYFQVNEEDALNTDSMVLGPGQCVFGFFLLLTSYGVTVIVFGMETAFKKFVVKT